MGTVTTAIVIIVGLPLILIGGGFFLLTLKAFRGGDARVERAQTLELARKLERTLGAMEARLVALEDIILSAKLSARDETGNKNESL